MAQVWIHRTTKQILHSLPPRKLPEDVSNYIEEPDLSEVQGQPVKYWVISGDTVSLADQATRDSIDAAELEAARDSIVAQLDQQEDLLRAFAVLVMDEFNDLSSTITAILDAADNATSLADFKVRMGLIANPPQRTLAQLKQVMRNKLGT